MSYFTYNNISSETMGIKIISMPPPSRAEQVTETLTIPGRAEPLLYRRPEYLPIEHEIEFAMLYNTNTIRSVYSWLSGIGNFVRSDESDKYYVANACPVIEATRISDDIFTMIVKIVCQPFAYNVANSALTVDNPSSSIIVGGSVYSEPLLKIFTATGNLASILNLYVNGKLFTITGLEASPTPETPVVTLDTTRRIAYQGSNIITNKTVGKFPIFEIGTNTISWQGILCTVSKIEVTKNERWL